MKVCVVGAGVAGLAAIRRVAQVPGFRGVVYEQSGDIGGIWSEFENQAPCYSTPMYHNLRTNFPREVTQYLDFEFKSGQSSYVYREEFHQYLRDYVNHFNLLQYIQFHRRVKCLRPVKRQKQREIQWEVTVEDLDTGKEDVLEFDAVMVCSGHYYKTYMPDIPEIHNFRGAVLHSRDYKSAEEYANKDVVIVGGGPSAVDIAVQLAPFARKVIRSFRQIPQDEPPPCQNIVHVGPISKVLATGFVFDSGEEYQADYLICATGYLYELPFLHGDCEIEIREGKAVTPLYKHMIHPKYPSLAFIGIPFAALPLYLADIQSRLYLQYLSGAVPLPSEEAMMEEIQEELKKKMAEGIPLKHFHRLGEAQWDYFNDLAEQGGFAAELKSVFRSIFEDVCQRMIECRAGYKDDSYRIIDSLEFTRSPRTQ